MASDTSSGSPERTVRRDELIAHLRDRLINPRRPRLVVLLILTLAGAAAFGTSVGALRLGLDSMALRYAIATLCGYAAFLALIRLWIALQRGEDLGDVVDTARETSEVTEFLPEYGGGAPEVFDFSVDLEEGWFVALAIACALIGLVALAYVVYIAPMLLAEVAVDAALVSAVYRRLRRGDIRWWAASVFRRTWLAAVALVIFMGIAGFALQQIAPDARSIGGVVRELNP
jgi:hypothetical protein